MPSFNTEGKSKEDLAIVAQLAGLLTLEQTSNMTRSEIAKVIDRENRKIEAAARETLEVSAGASRPVRVRKVKTAAEPVQAAAPEALAAGQPAQAKKKITRKPAAVESAPVIESTEALADISDQTATPAKTTRPAKSAGRPARRAAIAVEPIVEVRPPRKYSRKAEKLKEPETAILLEELISAPAATAERLETHVSVEPTAPVAETALQTEIQPETQVAESAYAETAMPAEKRKRGRRPGSKAAAVSQPAAAAAEDNAAPAISASPDVQPAPESAETSADTSPEAAEAAFDREITHDRAGGHHVPPHHTLTPNRPGQRRTRIIGQPEKVSADAAKNRTGRGPQIARQPGRPARQVRTVNIGNDLSPAESAAMFADATAEQHPEEYGTATILPLPSAADHAAHRPAVEAGDVQAGVLEIMPDGYGFLRKENYLQGNKDIYVPPQYIRRFGLRQGDHVSGPVKLQRENDRYQALLYIKEVNGMSPEKMIRRPHFDKLTPIYPDQRFILETVRNELSTRIIDLVAPIGKGQRGMIVSPPKAGKTILLQKIANAISINNPEVKLIVLLIDERPEEVTDMQRSINGEVVYSTFDKTPENHTKVTELVLERAMRLVELKQDVVILLDSMTRLARAYNLSINPTGRTLSGGLDPGALYGPKRFFGAARNIENGGSLTIIATSLIETGSRMDEVIFEEFKGTGNMEVYLDRKMSEKRIFPAIDINKSGTRREELLMTSKELDAVWTIRKAFGQLDSTSVTEAIINLLLKTTSNTHFISSVNVSFNDKNVFEAMRGVRPSDSSQTGQAGPGGQSGPGGRGGGYSGYNSSGFTSGYRRPNAGDED